MGFKQDEAGSSQQSCLVLQAWLAVGPPAPLKSFCSIFECISTDYVSSPGSAEAMESGNEFQARFSPVAVVYEFTWRGTGECSPRRAVPESWLLLLPWHELRRWGALEPFPQLAQG